MLLTISDFIHWIILNKVILIILHALCCFFMAMAAIADPQYPEWSPRKIKSKQDLLIVVLKSCTGLPGVIILFVVSIMGALLSGVMAIIKYYKDLPDTH